MILNTHVIPLDDLPEEERDVRAAWLQIREITWNDQYNL